MARPRYLGLGVAVALVLAVFPSLAQANARVSRSGNTVTLSSDARGDHVQNAGTNNRRVISFLVPRGHTLRAGRGCRRLRGPGITRVVVTCGAPSQTQVNRVTLRVNLGGGDDTFVAAPADDVQPRIIADGGAGDDTIYGSTNADDIRGGAGADRLYGLDDVDNLDGGEDADVLVGGAGDDGLVGGPGADTIFGDEQHATSAWGNDVLVTAVDGAPDRASCGEGTDSAIVDSDDAADSSCEILAGGQSSPPRDATGTLPLTVTIGALARTPGGLAGALRGEPLRLPVTFSASAQIVAKLRLSAAEARRLGVPRRERVIAEGIGTPLTLTPLTLNTQIRLRWPVRQYLYDDDRLTAKLVITARDVNGVPTTASKDITLRR
ncbi:MAG TPA: calcium-binding protein [Thermoleophilaceae bacterium]|nr:calcium-binding protein [Thermoleophilaceae bacterium]